MREQYSRSSIGEKPMSLPGSGLVLALLATVAAYADDPAWYSRCGTWHESMIRSREALVAQETGSAATAGSALAPGLGPWFVLGPIATAPKPTASDAPRDIVAEAIASGAASRASVDISAPQPFPAIVDTDGRAWKWTARLTWSDAWIRRLFDGHHRVYLRRTIESPTAVPMPIYLDAIGELTVWVNGQEVLSRRAGQIAFDLWGGDPAVHPVAVSLPLVAGTNDLIVCIELSPPPRPSDDPDPWRKVTLEQRRPWGTVFNGYASHTGPALEYEKLVYRQASAFYFSTVESLGPTANGPVRDRELLWDLLFRDFRDTTSRRAMEAERAEGIWSWDWPPQDYRRLAARYAQSIDDGALADEASRAATTVSDLERLNAVRLLSHRARWTGAAKQGLVHEDSRKTLRHEIESLRLAIEDLMKDHGSQYPQGAEFLARWKAIQSVVEAGLNSNQVERLATAVEDLDSLRREALLANPLLQFERMLVVKRRANAHVPDLPFNWANNSSLATHAFENEIAAVTSVAAGGTLSTVFKPDAGQFVGDLDLHFDAGRLLFSMPGSQRRWQVFEMNADGSGLRQVSRGDDPDVDNFDACYLPSGKIIFCSTAVLAGVPCVRGRDYVGVLYVMDADGSHVRQLCFEQDQDFCPTVMPDGRVLYTRWEYADVPHFFSRILFTMNPDGTDQRACYGSNSYWPNGVFYARPAPGHPTRIAGVVSGHHASRRFGELVLFDTARGQQETDGVVQRIPGRGEKVEPVINDRLVTGSWPRFLHPYPLNDKYYLVACKRDEHSRWGIYLADVFDNLLPLCVDEHHDLLEPTPLVARPRPPVIPDRTEPGRRDAVINLADVYAGPGVQGVPRGTIQKLRVIAYHYAYQNMAEDSQAIGIDSSWDTVKIVLGTVPVHKDGSAMFRVPANTPITIQPLDAQGRAVQLMRSWLTAMPGETQSCVGCHADANVTPAAQPTLASQAGPAEIETWHGRPRGFSFRREVQPVLERYCVSCHDGAPSAANGPAAGTLPHAFSLADGPITDPRGFSPGYIELQRYVRRPGAETDLHLLPAAEYHASTSELVQLLEQGHYGVRLDAEAWDRLVTWIDLNVPFHGTWHEAQGRDRVGKQDARRNELRMRYAGLDDDPEQVVPVDLTTIDRVAPDPPKQTATPEIALPGWPFNDEQAAHRQQAEGGPVTRTIQLGDGVQLELVRIPGGVFVMGESDGDTDEQPRRVEISKPFWMGRCEVTNEQFARFDPAHDSRYVRTHGITSNRGYPVNLPRQPVVRVSWDRANAFCQWLSQQTGETFRLPSEAMWEYACRAGTATPFSYGSIDSDFSTWANLADAQVEHLRDYSHNATSAWIPRDSRGDDRAIVTAAVGSYRPNAWGLFDMHGNAAEWTRTPYIAQDADNPAAQPAKRDSERMVVRGGSWYDRPRRARSAFRVPYPAWQSVHNVGFRVTSETGAAE
jgi:formylglycine-generating enzyme required for sulfatase activity